MTRAREHARSGRVSERTLELNHVPKVWLPRPLLLVLSEGDAPGPVSGPQASSAGLPGVRETLTLRVALPHRELSQSVRVSGRPRASGPVLRMEALLRGCCRGPRERRSG